MSLKPNQIIVVGTNLAGHHHGGAAYQAYRNFGLKWGKGEGLSRNKNNIKSYAFPTLTKELRQRSKDGLIASVQKLYECCRANPDKEFLLTKVGCGIAGYRERTMKYLFADSPSNLIKPNDWKI